MSNLSTKRQRANTNGDCAAGPVSHMLNSAPAGNVPSETHLLDRILNDFDERTLRKILLSAALQNPDVLSLVTGHHNDKMRQESIKVLNFDHYSKSVLRKLQQGGGSGSQQYHKALEVGGLISSTIAKILKQTPEHASFGTKKSALETLEKMGKSIAFAAYGTFRLELITILHTEGGPLEGAINEIVTGMDGAERKQMHDNRKWIANVRELMELGKYHVEYVALEDTLKMLGEEFSDLENDNDQDNGDEDEESDGGQRPNHAGHPTSCGGHGCGHVRCSSCWGN